MDVSMIDGVMPAVADKSVSSVATTQSPSAEHYQAHQLQGEQWSCLMTAGPNHRVWVCGERKEIRIYKDQEVTTAVYESYASYLCAMMRTAWFF